jgi:hypothetical protein
MHPNVRQPAVAGTFYAAGSRRLEADVRALLAAATLPELGFALRILIVPHAGLVYSGPIAATGYRLLAGMKDLQRVVMLGPAHYVAFSGLALPGADLLETPLGVVPVDPDGVASLKTSPLVAASPAAHEREHSLEVQLPFLQVVAPGVSVIPLLTGQVAPVDAAEIVSPLLDASTLLLVSSDLSHFHDAATARRLDAATTTAIERLDPDALGREAACGRTGIQTALHLAHRNGFAVETLDLRNSADTAGSSDRVVGYGTFALGR